jgi:hypothetical protein
VNVCTCPRCNPLHERIRLPRNVENHALNFLSVSGVDKFAGEYGCPVAWGYRYIHRIRDDETVSKTKGDILHGQLQHYACTGEDVLEPTLRAGKHFVYDAGPGLVVEHESLGEISIAGVPFYVRLDLANCRDYWLDDQGNQRSLQGAVEVNDWKTMGANQKTGELFPRAKLGVDLIHTTQMAVYAHWALTKIPHLENVRLSHSYFSTWKHAGLKSSALVTRARVDERVAEISEVVERMKLAARHDRAEDLTPNTSVCQKTFKGCDYLAFCPHGQKHVHTSGLAEMLAGTYTEKQAGTYSPVEATIMSAQNPLAALLGMTQAPAAQPAPTAPTAPPPAPVPAPAPVAAPALPPGVTPEMMHAAVAQYYAQLQASQAGAPAAAPPVAQALGASPGAGLAGNGPNGSQTVSTPAALASFPAVPGATVAGLPPLPVVPPDAPASGVAGPKAESIPAEMLLTMPPAIQAAHAAVVGNPTAPVQPAAPAPIAQVAVPVTQVAAPAPEVPVPAEPPKRKPGRPKKSETAASAPAGSTLTVYVDVTHVAGDPSGNDLQDYIDELVEKIKAAVPGTIDIRLADPQSSIGFGKWKAALELGAESSPPAPGVYYVTDGDHEITACVLAGLAKVVRKNGGLIIRGR